MNRSERAFKAVSDSIIEVIEAEPSEIVRDARLADLGANSIDRADIVACSMDALGLSFPLRELAAVKNIGGLVDALAERLPEDG